MGRIALVSDEAAEHDPVLQVLFEGAKQTVGRVPNSLRTYAHLPLIAAWQGAFTASLQREGGGGSLDGRTKELVVLKTSMVNECEYCVTHNKALSEATGISEEQIGAIRDDYASSDVLSDRDKAVVRWAEAVSRNEAPRDKAAFEALQEWFTDSEILEVTWLSAMFNMLNRVHDALLIDIEPPHEVEKIKSSKIISQEVVISYLERMCATAREHVLEPERQTV